MYYPYFRGKQYELILIRENAKFLADNNIHPIISPFERIDNLEFIYSHMPYLELLGNELSKPIIPKKANLEYLASQYLCELIKQMGYHGIIYKSSIDTGTNYVIFNDNRLKAGTVKEYSITEMKFETDPKT